MFPGKIGTSEFQQHTFEAIVGTRFHHLWHWNVDERDDSKMVSIKILENMFTLW